MNSRALSFITCVVCLASLSNVVVPAAHADNKKPALSANVSMDNIDARIKRGVDSGALSAQQATSLRDSLKALADQVASERQANGGQLKPEQLKHAENVLNESNSQIKSFVGAGTKKVDSEKVLGPEWSPGLDGAQNPAALHKQMKQEEKRELRQYNQAMQQKTEEQQLEYEKNVVPKLGGQRKTVLQQKKQLNEIRKESGAN
jgi:hypothetical protein